MSSHHQKKQLHQLQKLRLDVYMVTLRSACSPQHTSQIKTLVTKTAIATESRGALASRQLYLFDI